MQELLSTRYVKQISLQLVTPPLTEMYCPVIHLAFSETSKSTASAISFAVPALFAARVISIEGRWNSSAMAAGIASVKTGPGATALTVMPLLRPH